MKVKATRKGYYGKRRIREGQEFLLDSKNDFSGNWMEEMGASKKEKPQKAKASTTKEEAKEIGIVI